jgi:hypothetical protein
LHCAQVARLAQGVKYVFADSGVQQRMLWFLWIRVLLILQLCGHRYFHIVLGKDARHRPQMRKSSTA